MNLQSLPNRVYIFALILLCYITRLPQLLSPNLLLDGDECILGLMAKHFSEGKEIPVFFYGQNYGFSLIEAGFGAIGFLLFGVNAIVLRLSLLLIWSIGVVFFFLTFLQITNKKKAFLITLLMVLIPAWAIGSMKARGGYITAFTLTNIVIYLLFKAKESPTIILSFIIGILTYLIFLSRPFWIPVLLPVFIYFYLINKDFKGFISLASGVGIMFLLLQFIIPKPYIFWEPDLIIGANYFDAIKEIPNRIFYNVTGSYCLEDNIKLGFFDRITTYIWDVIVILLFVVQIIRIIFKRINVWSLIFSISVLLTIAYTPFFTHKYGARYLLPYSQFLILWLGIEIVELANIINGLKYKSIMYYLIITLCIFSSGALIEFKDFNFLHKDKSNKSEQQRMDEVISYLKQNGVNNAFALDGMFQWMLTFYSKEEIVCRWLSDADRYPPFPKTVDKAIKDGKPIALIWANEEFYKLGDNPDVCKDMVIIGDYNYVYLYPTKELLKNLGFAFSD